MIDGGVAWHIHLFDRLAHGPLHAAQETALPRGQEQDGVAAAASSTGAANAVDIGLRIEGDVVVDHQADPLYIEAAGSHIGGYQYVHLAALKPLDGALSLGLGHVAVEHGNVVTVLFKRFGHGERDRLGTGKNDHTLTCLGLQYPLQGCLLVGRMHHQETLTNAGGIGGLLLDRDLSGSVEIFLRYAPDFGRHGGRKQHYLALLR